MDTYDRMEISKDNQTIKVNSCTLLKWTKDLESFETNHSGVYVIFGQIEQLPQVRRIYLIAPHANNFPINMARCSQFILIFVSWKRFPIWFLSLISRPFSGNFPRCFFLPTSSQGRLFLNRSERINCIPFECWNIFWHLPIKYEWEENRFSLKSLWSEKDSCFQKTFKRHTICSKPILRFA